MSSQDYPLYKKIYEDLLLVLKTGSFDYDNPICTEKELCLKYGVSRITAKRAIDELESQGLIYRKRGVGSFAVKKQPPIVSRKTWDRSFVVMLPFSIMRGGILEAIEVMSNELSMNGILLTLRIYKQGLKNEFDMIETLSPYIDGLIYYPSCNKLPNSFLSRLCGSGRPVVIIDKASNNPKYSSVTCDNFDGSYQVTTHLLHLGHKNICYLTRSDYQSLRSVYDRYNGCRKAIEDFNLPIDFQLVRFKPIENSTADYIQIKDLIRAQYEAGTTAIVCENDGLAFSVNIAVKNLGLQPGKEISLTGFDNIEWATTAGADITTVNQDFKEIGRSVSSILLQDPYIPVHQIIPVSLARRSSTGSPQ